MKEKPWWESMTVWMNVLGLAVLVAQYVLDYHLVPASYEATTLAILNILNRFRTVGRVTLS